MHHGSPAAAALGTDLLLDDEYERWRREASNGHPSSRAIVRLLRDRAPFPRQDGGRGALLLLLQLGDLQRLDPMATRRTKLRREHTLHPDRSNLAVAGAVGIERQPLADRAVLAITAVRALRSVEPLVAAHEVALRRVHLRIGAGKAYALDANGNVSVILATPDGRLVQIVATTPSLTVDQLAQMATSLKGV